MTTEDMIQWGIAPGQPCLSEDEIHVWASCLDVAPTISAVFAVSLSEGERMRAKKFRFRQHQNFFIAGRGLLRAIMSYYLQVEPARVEFKYNLQGKPDLTRPFDSSGIHFNLAHSEDLALFAVTRIGPVGIDVERIRVNEDARELMNWFCSPRERELFDNLAAQEKQLAFFNLWTRKEAFLKATGEGITQLLNQVEVAFRPGEPARFIAVSGDSERAYRWSVHDLSPAPDFVAAVAIQAKNVRLRCWKADRNLFDAAANPVAMQPAFHSTHERLP
jgi:4'-phosphopantetheinyl transferase